MDSRPVPRRKRSRFASSHNDSLASQPQPVIGFQSDSHSPKPLNLPKFSRGKYTALRSRANSSLELKSSSPPDASTSLFERNDDESDDDSHVLQKSLIRHPHDYVSAGPLDEKPSLPSAYKPAQSTAQSLPLSGYPNSPEPAAPAVAVEPDPLDSFMQALTESSAPTAKRSRTSLTSPDRERPDSPSLSEDTPTSARAQGRPKRVYEKVDHSKIDYPSFEKNLYIEVPEISAMSHAQVAALRRSLDNMRVRGRDSPRPITTWAQCGLSSALLAVLGRCDFVSPTPIQSQAIPCIMSGRDVIGIARTGSGKTLAFLLPLFRHIARRPRAIPGDGPSSLIIAPTRELAIQIYGAAKRLAKAVFAHCVCAYGGSGLKDQIAELKRGADVVICTPGRMIDLLAMNSGRICNLRRVTYVVLDEADRMFDMGFEPQLTRIIENIRPDRQTVMFSATFPIQVEKLARKILKQPIEIMVGGNSVAAATIDQHVEVRSEDSKFFRLLELLGVWYERGSTLIFVDRQDNADRIFRDLSKARYKCLPLHGGMDQADRDSTIVDFKNGDVKVLVATSVAARGLDVKNLTLVVNYDVPSHYEDYVHRVGRTGRAGRSGTAYTFITPEQEAFAPDLVRALERSARTLAMQGAPEGDSEEAKRAGDEAAATAVADDLRKLATNFEMKRKAGIVKFGGGSGYGGRGFKFEENDEYNATKTAIRKMQAKQYGMEDEVDDDESDDGEVKPLEEDNGDTGVVSDDDIVEVKPITKPVKGGSAEKSRGTDGISTKGPLSDDEIKKLLAEAEIKAEESANIHHVDENRKKALIAQAKAQILSMAAMRNGIKPGPTAGVSESNEMVKADEAFNEGEGTGSRFAGELEINDYPAHARWQVVRKGALSDVEEFTGCVVTTRGNYYPSGRNPPAGERKLHFLIEGPSRSAVKMAKRDIRQKLEEASAVSRPGDNQYTKYSVV